MKPPPPPKTSFYYLPISLPFLSMFSDWNNRSQLNKKRLLFPQQKHLHLVHPPPTPLIQLQIKIPKQSCQNQPHLGIRQTISSSAKIIRHLIQQKGIAYFSPIQFLGPTLNGAKAPLLSALYLSSPNHLSGTKLSGSLQFAFCR